ncbi:Rne/Rng family ribonuclease [Actinoplanes sp. NPDC049265]|uniref:Rne/Rng family ribonuclease n=1 Tax=Actinoplanes sp. NPDC049265 TaxID=3363902 RepID=UPI00371A617E
MLDNEPQGGDEGEVTPQPAEATESNETAAPARRTRARKKAAPPAAPPADEPGAAIEVAATEAPVRARRARKKAAPAAAAEPPASAADSPASAADSPVDEVAGVPAPAAEKPVKRTRARKKAAPPPAEPIPELAIPPAQAIAEDETPVADEDEESIVVVPLDDELVEEKPAPRKRGAALPPVVLFMPPEAQEEPPAPARRSRKKAVPAAEAEAPEAGVEAGSPVGRAAEEEPVEEAPRRSSRRRRRGAAEEAPAEAEAPVVAELPALEEVDESADDVEDDAADDDTEDDESGTGRRRRRRGRRGRGRGKGPADENDEGEDGEPVAADAGESEPEGEDDEEGDGVTRRRRRRRRKGAGGSDDTGGVEDGVHTVVRVREPRRSDEVQGVSGSTRLEAKRQRRRDGREQRRTRPPILSESEFLARREAVDRVMVVRQKPDRTQIAVLEDGVLVEHYVSRSTSGTMVGNVYLGKVQNVLPSMEAAFVDVGRGRNAVLYAGEVNWDATGLEGRARSIEQALRSGDSVLVQVTKDPIGHKGARLSSHIALSGRHLVYVPNGNASGISRKLPDTERKRLRDVLKKLVPDGAGVIVRTAAEGASEDELARDVKRLQAQWEDIQAKAAQGHAPAALSEEPDLVIRVVRDLFNEDFNELVVQGDQAYGEIENYLNSVSPDLVERLHRHAGASDIFADKRIDEQILKGLDRKVFLPSGGHLVIDRTEAMTVVDVNTGKYTGAGGNLEETVTRNNLEAAEEIVRQLRLRDLGGIVVIDFIDMVLESNRELVLRRLTECLGRDRTKHQVTEITSLGLVQMTRKRIGAGLLEAFSETCDHCKGRGVMIHTEPVPEKRSSGVVNQVKAVAAAPTTPTKSSRRRGRNAEPAPAEEPVAEVAVEVEAPVFETVVEPVAEPVEAPPVAPVAPVAGSGIIGARPVLTTNESDDDYDMSGYDLSRFEANGSGPLAGSDDPDAAGEDDEDDDDEPVGAGAGRRRSRRGGTRRRTRP